MYDLPATFKQLPSGTLRRVPVARMQSRAGAALAATVRGCWVAQPAAIQLETRQVPMTSVLATNAQAVNVLAMRFSRKVVWLHDIGSSRLAAVHFHAVPEGRPLG